MVDSERLINSARQVVHTEAAAIAALESRVDENFVSACRLMLACEGRVVVTGMGKSGHIGRKIAATLASTGTPAFFLHPGEASHGDMGMVTDSDVVIALSNSGETGEILKILPLIKQLGVPLIAVTGNKSSHMALEANVTLDVSVEQEACPLNLAPTASTTATLAMGDALAIALLEARSFNAEDFARSHPSGRLGRRLLMRIADIMHTGDAVPCVPESALVSDALIEMTHKALGMTAVTDEQGRVTGIFADSDLRRVLDGSLDPNRTCIREVMTRSAFKIRRCTLAVEVLKVMEEKDINQVLVVDGDGRLEGALNMHDLLRASL